jgi:magnesium transporter
MRAPVESSHEGTPFHTIPLGIYVSQDFTLTLCLQDNEVLPIEKASLFREQYSAVSDVYNLS